MKKIAIHSVPRSGSSWLGEIFNSSRSTKYCFQPLFSYALKDYLSETSTAEDVERFFGECLSTTDDFICQREKREAGILPTFEKNDTPTHVAYKEVRYANILERIMAVSPDLKLVGLIRNPLAVLASWFRAPREFNPDWDPAAEWFEGTAKNRGRPEEFYGFKRWMEAARLFEQLAAQYPGRVHVVRYEDLQANAVTETEALFAFAGLEMDDQVRGFLAKSQEKTVSDTYSVYRSKTADQVPDDGLDPAIAAEVRKRLAGDPLERYLKP